jgi:anti-sigma regulatory factor (Ser/Thr protein kinase)
MEMTSHAALAVTDRSHVSAARLAARRAADSVNFDETDAHRVGIVATELASNLLKHTGALGGSILLRCAATPVPEIELVALDRGPGMADVAHSLVDGHSTAGSVGAGLGAVQRLADEFDVYSVPGQGTVVWVRLRRNREPTRPAGRFTVAGVSVPMAGEEVCGDAWAMAVDRATLTVMVVDGLGHGIHAADAARAGTRAGLAQPYGSAAETLTAMHQATTHTRGAAAVVARLALQPAGVSVAGVGNCTVAIVGSVQVRRAASLGGILGHGVRQAREYQYPWTDGAMLILHSDGLTSHWSLDGYPGLRRRHPAVLAAVLYRDFQRGRDDVTVVAAREVA